MDLRLPSIVERFDLELKFFRLVHVSLHCDGVSVSRFISTGEAA